MDKEKIGSLIITEEDRRIDVNVEDRGKFVMRVPSPFERSRIAAILAQLLGGSSVQSFLTEDLERNRMIATLSVVVLEKPEWFSVERCMDEALLANLYTKFLEGEATFQEKLASNKFFRASTLESVKGGVSSK